MDADQIFITTLTEKTGITYDTIISVYKESGIVGRSELCQYYMEKFQMSYGFASTLADIITNKV